MQKEKLQEKLTKIQEEIDNQDVMLAFYKWMADNEEDKQKSAAYLVKRDQVEEAKKFNEKFIEFAKTLIEFAKTL